MPTTSGYQRLGKGVQPSGLRRFFPPKPRSAGLTDRASEAIRNRRDPRWSPWPGSQAPVAFRPPGLQTTMQMADDALPEPTLRKPFQLISMAELALMLAQMPLR